MNTFVLPDLTPALPELFIMVMGCMVLLIDVFLDPSRRYITYRLTQWTLLGAAVLTLVTPPETPLVTFAGH